MHSEVFKEIRSTIISKAAQDLKPSDLNNNNFQENLASVVSEKVEEVSERIYVSIIKDYQKNLKSRKKSTNDFFKRLIRDWGNGFDLLEVFIAISGELASDFRRSDAWKANELNGILLRLHGRGCQVASEVLALMRNGFAAGADARWRTLHEIAVTSLFLEKHGIEAAKRYYASNTVESYKMAMNSVSCAGKMGYEAPDDETIRILKNASEKVKEEFGNDISKPYGWANPYIGNLKNPKFSHIENDVELEHFRRNYGLASYNVHGSMSGLTCRASLLGDVDIILAGPSNSGFVEPGQNTAYSLLQINVAVLKYDNLTRSIYINVLMKMCNLIYAMLGRSQVKIIERYHLKGMTVGDY